MSFLAFEENIYKTVCLCNVFEIITLFNLMNTQIQSLLHLLMFRPVKFGYNLILILAFFKYNLYSIKLLCKYRPI